MRLMLDTSVLGRVCHPRKDLVARGRMLAAVRGEEHVVIVPAVAEYELRRELLLAHSTTSLAHLDDLCRVAMYAPVSVEVLRHAAALWADLRRRGLPTADRHALDGDVILAAQALEYGATVVTDNVKHLSRMIDTIRWEDVP